MAAARLIRASLAPALMAPLLALASAHAASAADGALDPSFAGAGVVTTPLGDDAAATALALRPGGGIVVAGRGGEAGATDLSVARYRGDGSLDDAFAGDGIATLDLGSASGAEALALGGDGRVAVAGWVRSGSEHDVVAALLRADGSLDETFGGGGIVRAALPDDERAFAAALGPGGALLVAGESCRGGGCEALVLRYAPDGTLDPGFGSGGVVRSSLGADEAAVRAAVVGADGALLVAGRRCAGACEIAVARFGPDGSLDRGFGGGDGVAVARIGEESIANALALDGDGRIVVAGVADVKGGGTDVAVARFMPDGGRDGSFSGDGRKRVDAGGPDRAEAVAVDPDGRIVVAGGAGLQPGAGDAAIVRLRRGGARDGTFGDDGVVVTAIGPGEDIAAGVAMRPRTRRIVAAGWSTLDGARRIAVMRYLGDATAPRARMGAMPRFRTDRSFRVRWSASDASSGVRAFDVQFRRAWFDAGFGPWTTLRERTERERLDFDGLRGRTYCFRARATDRAGNRSGWASRECTTVLADDFAMEERGSWVRLTGCTRYYAGTNAITEDVGARLRVRVEGKVLGVLVTECPGCGVVDVLFRGRRIARIDTGRAREVHKVLHRVAQFSRVREGILAVRFVGGSFASVDGFGASRA